jgi:two-component system cell cycle response regulator DivK
MMSIPSPTAKLPLVLFADDNEDTRYISSKYFEYHGFRVETAVNGAEALAAARTLAPDVVVMDLTMPQMDGWAATRAMKADPELRSIPVVVLTAHAFRGAEQKARAAGCDWYLTKPCLPERLLATVRTALTQRGDSSYSEAS